MDRLTERNKQDMAYYYPTCFNKCGGLGYSSKCDECDFAYKICEKLGRLEDLEEQGKLLKLPCAVGSLVYEPYQFMNEGTWEIDVHKIRLEDLGKIGKSVFLTPEEAEAALKELAKEATK